MKGQKEVVVEEVKRLLGDRFDNSVPAIEIITSSELEELKKFLETEIRAGNVKYSKDINNVYVVRSYARSTVMHHLKNAKELTADKKIQSAPKVKQRIPGLNEEIVPDYIKELVDKYVKV